MDGEHEITAERAALRRSDDPGVWEQLIPLVYAELRAIAHRQLRRDGAGYSLNTTVLVHETYLKLVRQRCLRWDDRSHFFAIGARVMRRVLIDYVRRHRAAKRAGAGELVPLGAVMKARQSGRVANEPVVSADDRTELLIALDDALTRLGALDRRLVQVVECRFFGGLTEEETAAALSITARTVRRDWIKAKAWLHRALRD